MARVSTQLFTLTATCNLLFGTACQDPSLGDHNFGLPSVTGEGFALDHTSCTGHLITPETDSVADCQATVTFSPATGGAKVGSLNLPSGPDVPLSGSGPATGTPPPATGTPPPPAATSTAPKKCKKGFKKKKVNGKVKCVKKKRK